MVFEVVKCLIDSSYLTMKSGAARASAYFNESMNFQFYTKMPKRLGPGCHLNGDVRHCPPPLARGVT
jgi:hypothetical protein